MTTEPEGEPRGDRAAMRMPWMLAVVAAAAVCISCDPGVAAAPGKGPGEQGAATEKATRSDPYDPAEMTFGGRPATVGGKRHEGPFALGAALSFDPEIQPLDPSPVKEIRIDAVHQVIEIAPGVKYAAWTFGGRVPGPTIRVRVGDRIRFSMTNRSDEPMPTMQFTSPPMKHSMDFHAAMVNPQDKYRPIEPGQTIHYEFTVNYPGVFLYHCATPEVLDHIAAGMYGMVVAEPRDGYPTEAAREYAIVQSELYVKPDPDGRRIDGRPLYVLDGEAARRITPSYTVFNGHYKGFIDRPLTAVAGERVRLFVLNVGPSSTSSFHVIGTIFDRVWVDGKPVNELRGMQTVLLGSASGAIVEFIVPEAGTYKMVDHHYAHAAQGAVGLIVATEPRALAQRDAVPSRRQAEQGR